MTQIDDFKPAVSPGGLDDDRAYAASVIATPQGRDGVWVTIPAIGQGQHGPCLLLPPLGLAEPAVGTRCLVLRANSRDDWWIVQYDSRDVSAAASVFSPGDIKMAAYENPDPGWIRADGQAVTITHPELRARLLADGSPHGTDGSGNPRVPDLNGRTPIGAGAGAGLTSRALGAQVGVETHPLSTAEMPVHSHPPGAGTRFVNSTAGATQADNGPGTLINPTTSATTTGNSGSGTAHPNMQPSTAVSFFVKT